MGIQQDFKFPTVYFTQKKVNEANVALVTSARDINKKNIERKVTIAYYQYQIARKKEVALKTLDSYILTFQVWRPDALN